MHLDHPEVYVYALVALAVFPPPLPECVVTLNPVTPHKLDAAHIACVTLRCQHLVPIPGILNKPLVTFHCDMLYSRLSKDSPFFLVVNHEFMHHITEDTGHEEVFLRTECPEFGTRSVITCVPNDDGFTWWLNNVSLF